MTFDSLDELEIVLHIILAVYAIIGACVFFSSRSNTQRRVAEREIKLKFYKINKLKSIYYVPKGYV